MPQMVLQAQYRSSNDGAESVEAKQETFGAEEEDAEDAGINLDAESVHARGEASEDDSDMEEGEIHGKHHFKLCASCHVFLHVDVFGSWLCRNALLA